MRKISASTHVSIGITFLTVSLILAAHGLGLIPGAAQVNIAARKQLCETLAIQFSLAAQNGDTAIIENTTKALMDRDKEIMSVGLRSSDNRMLIQVGDHAKNWQGANPKHSTLTHVRVPILKDAMPWGDLEIAFRPENDGGFFSFLFTPIATLIGFTCASGFTAYFFYMRRMLRHLDPSSVIPDRVKTMLNTLAEGVLILDKQERIVLANEAFAAIVNRPSKELQGQKASLLKWTEPQSDSPAESHPWIASLREGHTLTGVRIGMAAAAGTEPTSEANAALAGRILRVNSMPILGGDGSMRGALATFDDITAVEEKSQRLRQMLQVLQQSRDEINRQNQELQTLATTDPLTGCINRRSFFTTFESQWKSSKRYGHLISCIMVDIDHFKRINDRYGHSTGDQVLRHVAGLLKQLARDTDSVCRYGGEEFCILLPHESLEGAALAAERFRREVESKPCTEIQVTISVGLSSIELGAKEPQELLDQADKALYFAKRSGRNRFVRWDQVPANYQLDQAKDAQHDSRPEPDTRQFIPFQAVTALMQALRHRDAATADHSTRVADLAVSAAKGLLPLRQCFVLEVAAMLHDIGKLGVPDAILFKPGGLTEDEWKLMRTHDRMGVEIVSAAFGSEELTEIVRLHHAWFSGNPDNPGLPRGQDIPLPARILTIADAYDAMTSQRPYQTPKTPQAAFAELRRCAGTQFEPALVERFITAVESGFASQDRAPLTLPQQSALRIRLEIERLACALDEQDLSQLTAMATRISAVAEREGMPAIAATAASLASAADSAPDLEAILKTTNELLALCRSPQSLVVPGSSPPGMKIAA